MGRLGQHFGTCDKRNVVEDGFHQGAVKGRTRVDGRDNSPRRVDERTESRIAERRRIELKTAIDIRVDAIERFPVTPGEDRRFEFARGSFDMRLSYPCCTPVASISAALRTS
jgi:hypothetical protein